MSQSAITTYLGIDKREGLVAIGKRLLKSKPFDLHSAGSWHHFAFLQIPSQVQ